MPADNTASCPKCGRSIDLAKCRAGETRSCPACLQPYAVVEVGGRVTLRPPAAQASNPASTQQTGGFLVRWTKRWRLRPLDVAYVIAVPGSIVVLLILAALAVLAFRSDSDETAGNTDVPSRVAPDPPDEMVDNGNGRPAVVADQRRAEDPPAAGGLNSVRTVEEVVRDFDPSVCQIRTSTGSGSGFLVEPKLIATNEHVIGYDRPADLLIEFPARENAEFRGAKLVYGAEDVDLVLLRVESLPAMRPIPVHRSSELNKGEKIVIIGSPGGLQNVVAEGVFGSVQQLDEQSYLQLSASVNEGNSGGPALTLRGRLAGIVTMKSGTQTGIGYAIPGDTVIEALQVVKTDNADERRRKLNVWQARRLAKELAHKGQQCEQILNHYEDLARESQEDGGDAAESIERAVAEYRPQLARLLSFRNQSPRLIRDLERRAVSAEVHDLLRDTCSCLGELTDLTIQPKTNSLDSYFDTAKRQTDEFDRLSKRLMVRLDRQSPRAASSR